MSELLTPAATEKKAALKQLIISLHEGLDPHVAKRQFVEILRNVDAGEIARIEDELIREGMPTQEIQRLCDVHLAVFKDNLQEDQSRDADHPVQILMKEHELLIQLASDLKSAAAAVQAASSHAEASSAIARLVDLGQQIRDSQCHYVREENVIFPYLEKHGIVGPPTVMWSEHDRIRTLEKAIHAVLDADNLAGLRERGAELQDAAEALAEMFETHFYKENNILFPTALEVFTEDEWKETISQFAELGYWKVVPSTLAQPAEPEPPATSMAEGVVQFETGSLPVSVLERILDTMPVDFTFVDAGDRVQYFSNGKERVFPRTAAIIGRAVQQCHPEKSVHRVNQILDDFRAGRRDDADFWIQSGDHLITIRYFAVRDREGKYLGCLEVTQDATWVRSLQGERRLLQ